jgi:NADPH:quinone reductase-like Zn-dependent oxidoreductase
MPKTMKAAVVRELCKPLVIEEVAVPEPGSGQIQVKIEASGVCHTDLHAAEGDWHLAIVVSATFNDFECDEALDVVRNCARYSAVARARSFSSARSTTRCGTMASRCGRDARDQDVLD